MSLIFRLVAFCLLLFPMQSFALGKLGHQLVCQLAYEQLPLQQQQKIDRLLAQISPADQTAINQYLQLETNSAVNFANACVWADAIKKSPEYQQYSSWHYVNVARDDLVVDESDCPNACVVKAIELHSEQLTSTTAGQQLQALMFVGHWLGDIHQPLHVSFANDLGGNKNKINNDNFSCTSLHWYWDSCVLANQFSSETALYDHLRLALSQQQTEQWQTQTPYQWATESLMISRDAKLLYCEVTTGNYCAALGLTSPILLTDDYQRQVWPIMQQRLLLAIIRLSNILNKM